MKDEANKEKKTASKAKKMVDPAKFTKADWNAVYAHMAKSGLYAAMFTEDKRGGESIFIPAFTMSIKIPKPTYTKMKKPNA